VIRVDDLLLPVGQPYGPQMLAAEAVLWKEAWPVLRVHRHLEAAAVASHSLVSRLGGEYRFKRHATLLD
jgi:hypothetical protein